jgi:hypothetical protein
MLGIIFREQLRIDNSTRVDGAYYSDRSYEEQED